LSSGLSIGQVAPLRIKSIVFWPTHLNSKETHYPIYCLDLHCVFMILHLRIQHYDGTEFILHEIRKDSTHCLLSWSRGLSGFYSYGKKSLLVEKVNIPRLHLNVCHFSLGVLLLRIQALRRGLRVRYHVRDEPAVVCDSSVADWKDERVDDFDDCSFKQDINIINAFDEQFWEKMSS